MRLVPVETMEDYTKVVRCQVLWLTTEKLLAREKLGTRLLKISGGVDMDGFCSQMQVEEGLPYHRERDGARISLDNEVQAGLQ